VKNDWTNNLNSKNGLMFILLEQKIVNDVYFEIFMLQTLIIKQEKAAAHICAAAYFPCIIS
jgi:hypothetical protein